MLDPRPWLDLRPPGPKVARLAAFDVQTAAVSGRAAASLGSARSRAGGRALPGNAAVSGAGRGVCCAGRDPSLPAAAADVTPRAVRVRAAAAFDVQAGAGGRVAHGLARPAT